jgi:uncharacterized OB-fold protein
MDTSEVEYYNKSSEEEIRSYFDILKEQKLTQKCKKIIEKWNTPEEVCNFFKTIPKEEYTFGAERK